MTELSTILQSETDSTNELALGAIKEGAEAGTVFVADRQTAGRGRRETGGDRRRWFSPPGENLYFSVVARPDVEPPDSSAITIAVGVELAEHLREITGVDVELKWPNDLYVGMQKLGGILTEGVADREGLRGVAVGVGLNVNVAAEQFPGELAGRATSLRAETGRNHDRLSLALSAPERVLAGCRTYGAQGLEAYTERIDRLDWLGGRRVMVDEGDDRRTGVARGIASTGALLVEFDDGTTDEVVSGEVTPEEFANRE